MKGASPAQVDLADRFGWGHLKDHHSKCAECNGTGREDPADEEPEPEECCYCDAGLIRWGSFYANNVGECEFCERPEDLPIGEMYEAEREWVCLPCYLRHHKENCGCALWARAEKASLGLCAALPALTP